MRQSECKVFLKNLLWLDRQREAESASLSFSTALCPYPPVVGFHQRLGDGQANSTPAAGARPGFICAVKTVEHQRQLLRREANSGIGNRNHNLRFFLQSADRHNSTSRRVLKRVTCQVREDLQDAIFVHEDVGKSLINLYLELYTFVFKLLTKVAAYGLN